MHVDRKGERRLHDGGVTEDLARRHVPPLGDPVPRLPQLPHDSQLAAPPHLVHAGRTTPGVLAGLGRRRGRDRVELLARPLQLALPVQLLLQRVAQVDEEFHVQRGVAQPGLGQRAGGPVDGGVALLQDEAEDTLDHGAEADPGEPGEPAGQLGVEQRARHHAYLAQAGQVLGGRVQHPFDAGQRLAEAGQVGAGDGVDQRGAGPLATQLHQVGAVAVAGGALGVDGDGAGTGGERGDHLAECGLVDDHRRNALAGLQQWSRRPRRRPSGVVRRSASGGAQGSVCCGVLGVGHMSRVSMCGQRPSPERSVDGRRRVVNQSGR